PAGVVTASLIGRVARDLWRNRAVYERSPFRCVMVAARREVERRGQRVLLLGGVQGAHKRYVVERQEKKLSVQSQLCCGRFPERLLQTLPQRLGIVSRLDPRVGEDSLLILIGDAGLQHLSERREADRRLCVQDVSGAQRLKRSQRFVQLALERGRDDSLLDGLSPHQSDSLRAGLKQRVDVGGNTRPKERVVELRLERRGFISGRRRWARCRGAFRVRWHRSRNLIALLGE